MSNRRMIINIDMDGAAFDGEFLTWEISRILLDLSVRMGNGISNVTKIHDINGNRIGQAEFYED